MIRLTYDPSVDALMIELAPDATSVRTVRVTDTVRADVDARGAVIGLEILDAAAQLGREAVESLPTGGRLLTLAEAARASGRAVTTLRNQLNAGRLTGVKRGRDWYVEEHTLLTYLENLAPSGRPVAKTSARKATSKVQTAALRARRGAR